MRCHSVGCGTASQTQSATQSTMRSFAVAHMMLWFGFTMQRVPWLKRTSTRAISRSGERDKRNKRRHVIKHDGWFVKYGCCLPAQSIAPVVRVNAAAHKAGRYCNQLACCRSAWSLSTPGYGPWRCCLLDASTARRQRPRWHWRHSSSP